MAPDRATAQAEEELPADGFGPQARSAKKGQSAGAGTGEIAPTQPTLFHAATHLDPERYARDFARIAQEVVARLGDAAVELQVEVTATNPNGFPSDVIRTVTENARTLRMESFGFEEERV